MSVDGLKMTFIVNIQLKWMLQIVIKEC